MSSKETKQLIIHIGNHKTGTTSIQYSLFKNKSSLENQGYHYFCTASDGKIYPPRAKRWFARSENGLKGERKLKPGLAEQLAKTRNQTGKHAGKKVIISSEGFSYLFSENEISNFANELKEHFDDIKVVAYIRRQDRQAISHHQQGSESRTRGWKLYAARPRALPSLNEGVEAYLDYNQRLGYWAKAFGDENLVIRIFDKSTLKNGDAVDDFFDAVGIEKNFESLMRNTSNGFIMTKVGHLLNRAKVSTEARKVIKPHLDNAGKLLPSQDEAIAFYGKFKEGNNLLNQKFKINNSPFIFNDDFSDYPETETDVWTEESANTAILNLTVALKEYNKLNIRSGDAQILNKACEELKNIDKKQHKELKKIIKTFHVIERPGVMERLKKRIGL